MGSMLELTVYGLLGLAGVAYALNSHNIKFTLTDHMPGVLNERKTLFAFGFLLILLGLALAFLIGIRHNILTLIGAWLMLLGSAPWFNRRIVRKSFDRDEMKVIRVTILTGLAIVLLSLVSFFLPSYFFSPGTFFMGLAIVVLAGRLWWNMDPALADHVMVQSKRNYS